MSYLAGLLGGLDERRQEERARRYDEETRASDLEFKILSQLAQSDDDEIAALAGTGLLETLAGGGRPKKAKGLQGFLGDMSRSSYLPAITSTLQGRRGGSPPAPAWPGGAALPAGSPVEPGGPQMSMALTGAAAPTAGPPPRLEGATGGLNRLGMTDDFGGDVFPSDRAPLPAVPTFGVPDGPEAPQARYQRLFPSAAETAANVQRSELMAKFQSILAGLQMAQGMGGPAGDLATRAIMGQAGAPMPLGKPVPVNITFGDGTTAIGTMDPNGGQVLVNGQPVAGVIKAVPITQQTRTFQEREIDEASGKQWLITKDSAGNEISRVMTGDAPRSPAPEYSGTATAVIDGRPVVVQPSRTGGAPNVIGAAPPKSTGQGSPRNTAAAIQAQAWATEVKRRVTSLKAAMPNFGPVKPDVKPEKIDELVREVTGGKYASAVDLEIAGRGGTPAPTAPATPANPFGPDGANRIRSILNNRSSRR